MKIVIILVLLVFVQTIEYQDTKLLYDYPNFMSGVIYDDSTKVKQLYSQQFGSQHTVSKEDFIKMTSDIIKIQNYEKLADDNDEDLRQEIATDIVDKYVNKFTMQEVEELLNKQSLIKYVLDWKRSMMAFLINKFKITYDQEFLNELFNNSEFYGLNYDSYKILTFKFKTNKPN